MLRRGAQDVRHRIIRPISEGGKEDDVDDAENDQLGQCENRKIAGDAKLAHSGI